VVNNLPHTVSPRTQTWHGYFLTIPYVDPYPYPYVYGYGGGWGYGGHRGDRYDFGGGHGFRGQAFRGGGFHGGGHGGRR